MADIELVIKIPEEMWERIKDGYVPLGISKYLKKGTPLMGKELPLTQGRARAFSVEVAGRLTNGELIKALFPKGKVIECDEAIGYEIMLEEGASYCSWFDMEWWNTAYVEDKE